MMMMLLVVVKKNMYATVCVFENNTTIYPHPAFYFSL